MRLVLRLLSPLLGLVLAAAGLLVVIEVVAAWLRPAATTGMLVPWPEWRQIMETHSWAQPPVPAIAIAVAVLGLLLLLLGLLARRSDIALRTSSPEVTAVTSPRVLARLVGRRVRQADDVVNASVTASRRRVAVTAQGWEPDPQLKESIEAAVAELVDALPLRHRPRVVVRVTERTGTERRTVA